MLGRRLRRDKRESLKKIVSRTLIICIILLSLSSEEQYTNDELVVQEGKKYYSPDNSAYAIAIQLSSKIPADKTGVYIKFEKTPGHFYHITSLVGVGEIIWSSNNDFILIDNGTYTLRSFLCMNTHKGIIIGSIPKRGNDFVYIEPNKIISTIQEGSKEKGLIGIFSVALYTILEEKIVIKTIYMGNELGDYSVVGMENNAIIVSEKIYENTNSESPWEKYKEVNTNKYRIDITEFNE